GERGRLRQRSETKDTWTQGFLSTVSCDGGGHAAVPKGGSGGLSKCRPMPVRGSGDRAKGDSLSKKFKGLGRGAKSGE
ncbi:unnamed protein product, partial [Pylaiella littoralis]